MNNIQSLLHATVLVQDLDKSLAFYCDLLGLERDESRPDLGFAGVWLHVGAQQLHLMVLPNPDPIDGRPAHGGRDRHLALSVRRLDDVAAQLDHAGIDYSRSRSGRQALFCRDPDGNALEFIQVP
ncbi:MAG TPA: glyoxalase [Candidatus Tenderia sp.]|nr:glyoxalase [Candidatus Tenderia sp.]